MTVRVKICGIRNQAEADACIAAGVDALGFNFYPESIRYIEPSAAQAIISTLPPFVSVVGLFVNASAAVVQSVCEQVFLSALQFHGEESAAFCQQFNKPYIKAIRMKPSVDLSQLAAMYTSASALLVDSYQAGVPGGTGKTFAWSKIPSRLSKPLILAGGLTIDNIAEAVRQVIPYALDVCSGVEEQPGVKDPAKIHRLMTHLQALQ